MPILGGKTFRELGLIYLEDGKRPGPETRDRTLVIPGRAGEWDFGADIGSKPFELPCGLIENTAASLQQTIRALQAHLFDSYGKPKTMQLIFDDEPDVFYNVRFSGKWPISRIVGVGQFSLPLTAFDPDGIYIESTDNLNWGSDAPIRDDVYFSDQYSFQIYSPTNLTVNNFGALNAQPVTEITGSFSSLALSSDISGFNMTTPISGQTLAIDHGNYSAILDGQDTLTGMSSTFLAIPPGQSNVYVGGTGLNCTITFKFRPRWQ